MDIQLNRPRGLWQHLQLWGLYLEAFPATERKPFGMLLKMARSGKGDFWYLTSGGGFGGLAFIIHGDGLVLLDYFAIRKNQRGRGAGTAALGKLLERYREGGFFLEIESTLEPSENADQRRKRKAFYRSCGLEELGTEIMLFGVRMELLGVGCELDYTRYRNFYEKNLGLWAASHVGPVSERREGDGGKMPS